MLWTKKTEQDTGKAEPKAEQNIEIKLSRGRKEEGSNMREDRILVNGKFYDIESAEVV